MGDSLTVMLNASGQPEQLYVDIHAGEGLGEGGLPWHNDLYLDVIADWQPGWRVTETHVIDADELEEAVRAKTRQLDEVRSRQGERSLDHETALRDKDDEIEIYKSGMEQALEELDLGLAFLTSRLVNLRSVLENVDAERSGTDTARYLKRYIDTWREGVHDVVTQFTTIFLERAPSDSLAYHLQYLLSILTYSMLRTLLSVLGANLSKVEDATSLTSLLTQLTHFRRRIRRQKRKRKVTMMRYGRGWRTRTVTLRSPQVAESRKRRL